MHRLVDRFGYIDESSYRVNTKEDTGYVRLCGVKEDDIGDCRSLMSDGFDTISLDVEQNGKNYTVTARYSKLP